MILVPREDWGMPGNLGPVLSRPFEGVDLHHTAALDTDSSDPIRDLYGAAAYTSRRWGRVSYNGGLDIDSLGRLLEMQGDRVGAHNDGENSTRFGLVIAGNFQQQEASDELVEAIADAVVLLKEQSFIRTTHIKGHRDTDATSCPGNNLYRRLPEVRSLIEEKTTMPFDEHEVEVLKQLVEALDKVGSNGWFAEPTVEHLRNHPSSGKGVTVEQVHAIIKGTKLNP